MEYFGTIFVAVICFVLGYVLGRLKERKVYKSIENEWLEDRDGCFRDGVEEGKALAEKDLGWHSVEESLPPIDEEVIVLRNYWVEESVDPLYKVSFGHIVDKNIAVDYDGWNVPSVKYWMPMPKIPEK